MERIYSDLIDTDALNDIVDAFSNGAKGIANYIEAIGGAKSAFNQLGAIALKVLKKDISTNLTSMISNFGIAKNNARQLNAEIQIMQKFKGLVAAKNVFIELEDAMTETQRAQANALLKQRNEIANEKAI